MTTELMQEIFKKDMEYAGAMDIYESCITKLKNSGFFTMPASTKYHGINAGDLFIHSMTVAHVLISLTEKMNLVWDNPRSPVIVGYFHDLCKMDQYQHPIECGMVDVTRWEKVNDTLLSGHGDKSVMIASTFCQLTEEEMLCIRYHMGAYEKNDWVGYDKAIRRYQTVLYTHTADMLASKVHGI